MADQHDLRPSRSARHQPSWDLPAGCARAEGASRPSYASARSRHLRDASVPVVPVVRDDRNGRRALHRGARRRGAGTRGRAPAPWLDTTPNETTSAAPLAEPGIAWVNPDEPVVPAPPQAATGIEWLDSPATESPSSTTTSQPSAEDVDDVFGWDPAEERGGALDAAPAAETLEALKELEPWALPGAEPAASTSDDVADALERVAARIRSGELFVPGTSTAATDEAALASVLAALLQRARG